MSHFSGIVQKSLGEGTRLGFPTANIACNNPELSGIYAGMVTIGVQKYPAAVYADQRRKLLEAHILDFDQDLYGKNIQITLEKKIRDDRRFESEDDLKRAIAEDVVSVRAYFGL